MSDLETNKNKKRYCRDKMIEIKYRYIKQITSTTKQLIIDKIKNHLWNGL